MSEATASCPTCGATSVQSAPVKRSTVPKELAAEYYAATGTAPSDVVLQNVCSRCGCRWLPRTSQERQLKALSGQLGPDAMKAALGQPTAGGASSRNAAARKIPMRTWVIAGVMVIAILLAIFT